MPDARNPALEFIDEEFSVESQRLVAPALRRAYSAASALVESTDWLDTPSGGFQRGDLILKAAEYQFAKLIRTGHLNGFDLAWEDYAIPTGKHLVMRTRRALITISQVPKINCKPRQAVCRQNFGIPNTVYLFPEMNELAQQESDRKHLVVIHGYQELLHAAVAMPHPTKYRLIARTDNLLRLDPGGLAAQPPPEGPTEPPDLEAIEDLVRIVRDSK